MGFRATQIPTGPYALKRTLRYVDKLTFNPSAGSSLSEYIFSANGIYDPDITGTGHQPLGFDEYMSLYNHYKVTGSKMTIKCVPNSTAGPAFILGIYLDDGVTAATDSNNLMEQGQSTWAVVNAGDAAAVKGCSKSFKSSVFHYNKKYSAEVVGSDAANPAEQAFYKIWMQAIGASQDVATLDILVTIDYNVSFSERKTLATS